MFVWCLSGVADIGYIVSSGGYGLPAGIAVNSLLERCNVEVQVWNTVDKRQCHCIIFFLMQVK